MTEYNMVAFTFYATIPLALAMLGMWLGGRITLVSTRLRVGAAMTFFPIIAFVALYFAASGTGCSGGDCMGAMIGVMVVGVFGSVPVGIGSGIFLNAIVASLRQRDV